MSREVCRARLMLSAVLFLSLIWPAPGAAQSNLLVNGGFEAPDATASPYAWGFTYGLAPYCDCQTAFGGCCIPGWQITRGTLDVLSKDWRAAEGKQSIDLVGSPGPATIEQTFATVPGASYMFTGYVSHNPGIPYGRARVTLNDSDFVDLISTVTSSSANMHWETFSYLFRAVAASTTLTISDITRIDTQHGTALDGLAVSELPPAPQVQILLDTVNGLVGTVLNAGNGNALASTLSAVLAHINSGDRTAAVNALGAFIGQVNALVQSGGLPAEAGQALASSAQAIIIQLNS